MKDKWGLGFVKLSKEDTSLPAAGWILRSTVVEHLIKDIGVADLTTIS